MTDRERERERESDREKERERREREERERERERDAISCRPQGLCLWSSHIWLPHFSSHVEQ